MKKSYLTFTALLIAFFYLAPFTAAQTEFEGDVSGEWDPEGNPYIQTGNATIPQDESLRILPGVEVIIGEDMELTCNGLLTAIGSEEDTIRFYAPEGMLTGRLRINSMDDAIRFQYCRFDSLEDAIWSDNRELSVENCLFVDNYNHLDIICREAHVLNNHFTGADEGRGRGSFEFGGINNEAGTYILRDNIVTSRGAIQINVDNAEFTGNTNVPTPVGRLTDLVFIDSRDVVCSDNTGWFPMRITNGRRRLQGAIFENNDATRITVNDQADWGVVIRSNRFMRECGVVNARVEYYDNIFGIANNFHSSLCIVSNGANNEVILERNILYGIRIERRSDVFMRNNTINGRVMEYLRPRYSESSSITLINNIFQYFDEREYLVLPEIGEVSGGYNCFCGAEQPYGEDRDLLEGDLVQNPLMRGGIPYDYRLRADSPCIDAGDPESDEDPDGTRADIGCYYFDQENGEPPALDRRWDYYIGWGETFRYGARAVDEGEELQIEFDGLPEWLEVEENEIRRDFVRDSVFVSGEVPEDTEDFVFHVRVTDDSDREDTLSVRVMVYPYRVLTGIVRGELDIEQSPFIIADTAWIPAGDSLVLPPGTELYFDNRNDSLAERTNSKLIVEGNIKAVGTEEDSIYFCAYDQETDNFGFKFEDYPDGHSEFRYCAFKGIRYRNRLLNANYSFSHTLSYEGFNNEFVASTSAGNLDFFENHGDVRFEIVGNGFIHHNSVRSMAAWSEDSIDVYENDRMSLSVYAGNIARIRQNSLTALRVNKFSRETEPYATVRHNIFNGEESEQAFSADEVNIEFTNNTIKNGDVGIKVNEGGFRTMILNNAIYNVGLGIEQNQPDENQDNFQIYNNIFYSIDTLLYVRYGAATGVRFNSIFDVEFITNDTTFDARLIETNANGDSCDAYFNIYFDPKLADPDSLDFRLYADSPLIDAGIPDEDFNDVDSTINDIGPLGGHFGIEYEYLEPNETISFEVEPNEFRVKNVFPNPFNATSNIYIEIPFDGKIKLNLFDVQGRCVVHNNLQLRAGSHQRGLSEFLNKNVIELRSGFYVLTVEFGGKQINRKLVLVK